MDRRELQKQPMEQQRMEFENTPIDDDDDWSQLEDVSPCRRPAALEYSVQTSSPRQRFWKYVLLFMVRENMLSKK